MKERRRAKRFQAVYPIECAAGYVNDELTLLDVSKGGVAFSGRRRMRKGQEFRLKLFLKRRMVELHAVVVHARESENGFYSIGARFREIPENFIETFEKEIGEIIQFKRESNLYRNKDYSFKDASVKYLTGSPS